MKKINKYFYFFLFFVIASTGAYAQQQPFYSDIQAFKNQDSIHFPLKHVILFVGSSSFTKWTDVQDYFPGFKIINRGFGGSSLPDVIRYADEIIFPYQPKQIIIYCGENDFAASDTVSVQTVFSRFKQLFQLIRVKLPDVPIAYVSMKPSPSRQKLMPKFEKGNLLIKQYLKEKKNAAFIDVYHKMLNKDGTPIKDIFIEDNLHMNAKGYHIWQKIIKPYLLK
ncbi:MAG: GDSL-type esterase/lipase family protein [Bacteroidota bacterium]|nr:GDSL-type esterase/lipase family protein [Bacteroidota bacterium]